MLAPFRKQLKHLISTGQMIAAFEQLRIGLAEHSEYSTLILTRFCQYQSVKKQFIGGLLTDKEYRIEQIRVANVLLTLADEISETDLNPQTKDTLEAALQGIVMGQMGKLHLVNCDRQEPFRSFASFFHDHGALPYQFYFIAGSPSQKPCSFAERIIYEIIEDKQLLEGNSVVEYEHEEVWLGGTMTERVKFHPLPLGLNAESSQIKFKKYFSERMARYHLPVMLDTFFETRDKCPQFKYISLVFQLESDRWDQEVGRYVQWIVESFRKARDEQPKFLIFFVLHLPRSQEVLSWSPLPEIQEIAGKTPDCCLVIENLHPVSRDAVCAWFRSISTFPDERKIETVIDRFAQQLEYSQQQNGRQDFDMMDVEPLLERVYLQWLKK